MKALKSQPNIDTAEPYRVMIVAGEASGDEHAAALVRALLRKSPNAEVFGMGGSNLRAAGVETIVDSETSASVMGLTEVVGSLGRIISAFRQLIQESVRRSPDIAILLDFPDFNLRLARKLKAQGVRVMYYIAPQVWAWRQGRVHTIRNYIDKVAAIFPFEEEFYRAHGVQAEYVGHPFLDRPELDHDRAEFLRSLSLDPRLETIALLPGSRKAEIERLLTPMLDGAKLLLGQKPNLQIIVPVADTLELDWVRTFIDPNINVTLVEGAAREVLASVDAAVVASGTATVEAALSRTPFFVVYKLSPFTHWIARRLVKGVSQFAMANLIAGKPVVLELLQHEVTPDAIAAEFTRLLDDTTYRENVLEGLSLVSDNLVPTTNEAGNASARAAEMALSLASEGRQGR